MKNIETPLTWILTIGILLYLFITNYSNTDSNCQKDNEDNVISITDQVLKNDVSELNIDSMLTNVVKEIDSASATLDSNNHVHINEDREIHDHQH